MSQPRILLTGATGYVGGRLLKAFEETGTPVRCLVRHPENLIGRVSASTEVVAGDVLNVPSLDRALTGIETAYYLVHSMGSGKDFEARDRQAAKHFAHCAKRAGVRRLIYLGGLGDSSRPLSAHLRSRQEVGQILQTSGCQVIEFRASIVIGPGSLSFEMIRALVERLPVMITPRWVSVPAQPISIDDLLNYLVQAADIPLTESRIFEIGGSDLVSYKGLMQEYARARGLKRLMIPVPVLSPWLSSLWLGLVTPIFARIGRMLIESIRHPTIVRDESARTVFSIRPMGVREAIRKALQDEEARFFISRWSDSLSSGGKPKSWGGVRLGNRLVDERSTQVASSPAKAFAPIRRIGGRSGWYFANILWRIRGWLDLLMGGVGMRRGRRSADELTVGDVVDCWRVEEWVPDRKLRLRAEMKLPGRAWLEFEVVPAGAGSVIRQTAVFEPKGIAGLLYWYGVWPLHQLVFSGMLSGIARRARV